MWLGVNHDPRTDFFQAESKIDHEAQARLARNFFIALAVLQKPRSPVIAFDLPQKRKQFWSEIGLTHESPQNEGLREKKRARPKRALQVIANPTERWRVVLEGWPRLRGCRLRD